MEVGRSSARGLPMPEAAFDELLLQVTRHLAVRHASVHLPGADRLLSRPGEGAAFDAGEMVDAVRALCVAVASDQVQLVLDGTERGRDSASPGYFVGVPLRGVDGSLVGALCAWDIHPRQVLPGDVPTVEQFARHASTMIELHRVSRELEVERAVSAATGHLLEMIVKGAELPTVLHSLALAAQDAIPGTICSIHLLDGAVLREGASPHLPEVPRRAIDGARIGPEAGSCGTAAYTGRTVIVSDIATDPRWGPFVDLALPYGLRACWSVPILRPNGRVLGTFAVYYQEVRAPEQDELDRLDRWVNLAEVAISRARDIVGLREAATLDALTGAVNRTEVLARIAAAQAVSSARPAVLFVDLDQFKLINDTLGHAAGDHVLQIVARRLAGCAAPGDTVARFGGDEFVVLRPDCGGLGEAQTLAHRMLEALRTPMTVSGRALSISASIGIALRPSPDAGEYVDLVGDADLAMYAAKRSGRDTVVAFTPGMRATGAVTPG